MIAPGTALQRIARHAKRLGSTSVALDDALGYVLAGDIRSPLDLPTFDNSAMDGYALRSLDTTDASADGPVRLVIDPTVYAGDTGRWSLRGGRACAIMTGAPMPRGADAVVPVEQAVVDGECLVVKHPVAHRRHVRIRGEEIRKGARVLEKGHVIHPGTIACLASFGRARIRVIRRPAVSVVTTGNETVAPGARLAHGEIYDSNSHMLRAMLAQMGIEVTRCRHVKDHQTALRNAVSAALSSSDVVIVVGGVSMGRRDYVRSVLDRLRVREVFWRVAQKPGKPLYFGVRGGAERPRLVFGLPGNPASAFTCFYVYVYPALRRMAGFAESELPRFTVRTAAEPARDPKKWRFLKARVTQRGGQVSELPGQGSHMTTSLPHADSLLIAPPADALQECGEEIQAYRLPFAEDVR